MEQDLSDRALYRIESHLHLAFVAHRIPGRSHMECDDERDRDHGDGHGEPEIGFRLTSHAPSSNHE